VRAEGRGGSASRGSGGNVHTGSVEHPQAGPEGREPLRFLGLRRLRRRWTGVLAALTRVGRRADLGQLLADVWFLNHLLALFRPEPYHFCECRSVTEMLLKHLPARHSCSG